MNQRGDPANAVGRPAVADYPVGARMAPRVIGDFEFVWMLRGRARFATNEDVADLAPGRLLLVPPGLWHGFVWDDRAPSRHGYVHFGAAYLPVGWSGSRLRRMTNRDPLSGLCAYMVWLGRERPTGWEDEVERTIRYLCDTFTSTVLRTDEPAWPRVISDAIAFLRREWADMPLRRVTVGELAAVCAVSRSYLNRSFRRDLGLGVASALELLRCARAETLLARTDMTIGSIARQCGFADVYHLSHRFTHVYGASPSAFRSGGSTASSVLDHDGVRRLASAVWE